MSESSHGNLKYFLDKILNLEKEKEEISIEIKEIFDEAKSSGFETKIMKEVIKIIKMGTKEYLEKEDILYLYLKEVGIDPEKKHGDFNE